MSLLCRVVNGIESRNNTVISPVRFNNPVWIDPQWRFGIYVIALMDNAIICNGCTSVRSALKFNLVTDHIVDGDGKNIVLAKKIRLILLS